jgi:hypothetical protein
MAKPIMPGPRPRDGFRKGSTHPTGSRLPAMRAPTGTVGDRVKCHYTAKRQACACESTARFGLAEVASTTERGFIAHPPQRVENPRPFHRLELVSSLTKHDCEVAPTDEKALRICSGPKPDEGRTAAVGQKRSHCFAAAIWREAPHLNARLTGTLRRRYGSIPNSFGCVGSGKRGVSCTMYLDDAVAKNSEPDVDSCTRNLCCAVGATAQARCEHICRICNPDLPQDTRQCIYYWSHSGSHACRQGHSF